MPFCSPPFPCWTLPLPTFSLVIDRKSVTTPYPILLTSELQERNFTEPIPLPRKITSFNPYDSSVREGLLLLLQRRKQAHRLWLAKSHVAKNDRAGIQAQVGLPLTHSLHPCLTSIMDC